ncbi:MAG: MBL fold metallo-hydrolase [Ruminococcaceae bacterium]|nr:MBL fold metallo-hydrolase [Oscillospiraceae bacterium]
MKKIISIVLALVMIVPMMCFSASAAASITPDTSWYDASKSEFVIDSAADLYGFAQLANGGNTFAGKTVKLGADITINEGKASDWALAQDNDSFLELELIRWTPINGFAGTFDGQDHTISGVASLGAYSALFKSTSANCVIKNLNVVNSYFCDPSETGFVGVVSSIGGGNFEKIYSDAYSYTKGHHAGGIFGCATAPVTVKNSWFDGSVLLGRRFGGGIVGNGNGNVVVIENCLNSGSVHSKEVQYQLAHIGGMCGRNDSFTTIKNCLNVGAITSDYSNAGVNDVLGGIFGANSQGDATKGGTVIENCWTTVESCVKAVGTTGPAASAKIDVNVISESLLVGYGAYTNTTLDFENVWAVDTDGYPVLQCFADVIPTLYKVNNPQIVDYEVKAEGFYGPRWYVELEIPEGMTKDNVTLGALIVPTKALPAGREIGLNDESLTYRDVEYKVANVEAKIFRESEEGKLLASFVITDLDAELVRTSFTLKPYAIYTVKEGDIISYGDSASAAFYKDAVLESKDSATAAEKKALLDKVLAPIYEGLGGEFPVIEEWSEIDEFVEVPAYKADSIAINPAEDYGPEHAEAGNPTKVIRLDNAEDKHYYEYRKLLEQFGFKLYVDNGETGLNDSVYTAIYTKGDLVVTVTMISYQFQLYVTATYDMPLSEHLFDNFKDEAVAGAKDSLSMLEMNNWGNSFVIQLKNGHFLVNDGAGDEEFPYLMQYLQKLAGEGKPVVIEAWFVTHAHYDHYCIIRGLEKHPEFLPEEFYVEGFYINFPSYDVNQFDLGVYNEIPQVVSAIKTVKTTKGTTPEIYRPMTGQRYYFCDSIVEIPHSQEQLTTDEYYVRSSQKQFNDSSTWYKHYLNVGNGEYQTFLVGGDSDHGGQQELMWNYDEEYLDVDITAVLHHGYNSWNEFTDFISYKTLLVPQREKNLGAETSYAYTFAEEYFFEGNGNVMLTFPYKVGEAVQKHEFQWEYASVYGGVNGQKKGGA